MRRRQIYCAGANVTTKAYYFGKTWAVKKFKRAARTDIVRGGFIVASGCTDKTWAVQWPKTDVDSRRDDKVEDSGRDGMVEDSGRDSISEGSGREGMFENIPTLSMRCVLITQSEAFMLTYAEGGS